MDTYSVLRQFADSWAMLALFSMFVGIVLWVMRPGSRRAYEDVANIPFRHDDKPAPVSGGVQTQKQDRLSAGRSKEAR